MLSVDPLLSPTQERPGPGVLDLFADFEGVLGGFGSVVTGDASYLESKRQRSNYDQATTSSIPELSKLAPKWLHSAWNHIFVEVLYVFVI